MKRLLFSLVLMVCALPFALHALQETPALRLEITGVNATELPTATITANVYDLLGQPVRGLTAENFSIFGELEEHGTIVSVENISDDNLPFATVLVIDVSDSMSGAPIGRAQEAARAFINSVAENDPVALVSFGSFVNVIQDFTTDKTVLLNAIDSLRLGGRTALYQGAFDAINLAANSPMPRRAMVLLSDGAEFGGRSSVTAAQVTEEALVRGVPVYTIGLGFGADRTFLQRLSERTNGRFYESPTPDQLVDIYSELAAILRSQYVITLNTDLPLDGSEYEFGLRVSNDAGSAEATSILRAPIPVPIVRLDDLPSDPIQTPTTITANVRADDPLTGVTFSTGDESVTATEEPYTFTIDPFTFAPGEYSLSVVAQDDDGDTGTAEGSFTIAALASQVGITPNLSALGTIEDETPVTVTVTGQTPPTSIEYSLVGPAFTEGEFLPLDESSTILINPIELAAGANRLTIRVSNEGGVTATTEFPFEVSPVAPTLSIEGIENGQTFDAPFSFSVSAAGQTPNIDVFAMINNQVFEPESVEHGDYSVTGTFTLDPMRIEPGEQALMISANDESDMAVFDILTINIAALPPTILISGLEDGGVLAEETQVSINFISQTPVIHVAVLVDDFELAHLVSAPFSVVIDPLDYAPGEHTLRIAADNAGGQHSTLEISFTIAEGPSLTATSNAPTPTPDRNATNTQQAVQAAVLTATAATHEAQASATQAQIELEAANASATAEAFRATTTAQAVASGTQMMLRTETAVARATEAAAATSAAQASATAEAADEATRSTVMTATAEFQASATSDFRATSQAAAQQQALESTRDALATANVQARVEATSTADARATRNAAATATEAVNATAAAQQQAATSAARSNATATRLAQLLSTETAAAEASETAAALQTQATAAQATTDTQAALDAATETQAALDAATETREAQLSLTSEANVTETAAANVTATVAADQTQAFSGTATAHQQATIDTQRAAVGITLTPNTGATVESTRATEIAQAPETEETRPSPTAQPTLTLIEAENPPGENDLAPILIVGVMLLVLLLVLVLMFLARRRRSQR